MQNGGTRGVARRGAKARIVWVAARTNDFAAVGPSHQRSTAGRTQSQRPARSEALGRRGPRHADCVKEVHVAVLLPRRGEWAVGESGPAHQASAALSLLAAAPVRAEPGHELELLALSLGVRGVRGALNART